MKNSLSNFKLSINIIFMLIVMIFNNVYSTTFVVNNNHPNASDNNPGTEALPYKTISKGASVAQAGDIVLVHSGIYRETVSPSRGGNSGNPIVYQAATGEQVIIRGSIVWNPSWQLYSSNIYSGQLDNALFGTYNPYHIDMARVKDMVGRTTGDRLCLGQVFVDGIMYKQLAYINEVEATERSWYHNVTTDQITIHFDHSKSPSTSTVQITARKNVFAPVTRGLGYITVKGFIMEHSANQLPSNFWATAANAQSGALSTRSGNHWIIEDNTIRLANSIGLDCGSESDAIGSNPSGVGYHLIQNNTISDCGVCGIAGYKHTGTQIINNIIDRTNYLNWQAPENAGIKCHFYYNGLIKGNLMRDNAWGIWMDNQWSNTRITGNTIVGSRGGGIMIELGDGPILIDNNIIIQTTPRDYPLDPQGDGLYTHDTSGVTFANNLVLQSSVFSSMMRTVTDRHPDCRHMRIYNNMLLDGQNGAVNLPYPGPRAGDNLSESNLLSGNMTYVPTTYGGISLSDLQSAFNSACPGETFVQWNDPEDRSGYLWGQQYGVILNLSQWQRMMNLDLRSTSSGMQNIVFSKTNSTLSFNVNGNPWTVQSVSVSGVNTDFYGNSFSSNPIPGPFQNIQQGTNNLSIIPPGIQSPSNVSVTGLNVSPTSASINVSATQQLTATVSPSNATNINVSWSSSNSLIASVNSSGLVTGIAAGSATITVTTVDGSFAATCNITVNVPNNINPISASIKEVLKVFPNPSNGFINIMIPSKYSTCEVNIYNFMGAVIYNNILMNSEMNTINLSDQVSGVYFIKVNAGNSIFYKKFILINTDVR